MIKIYCSKKNLPEKKYLFDVIFGEFLGIDYELVLKSDEKNYVIELSNNNKIIIEDHFWNRTGQDELSYLNQEFLPIEISYAHNQFTFEEDLPVLYGNPEVIIERNNIFCSIDLFATIYFFLSRWEEYISTDRDFAERFKYVNSISAKFNIIDRPIVNELTEFLWNMLLFSGYKGRRKEHNFTPIITHDIDQPVRINNFKMFWKIFGKNLIRYKNIDGALMNIAVYVLNKFTPKYDLANCYEFLMDVSDSINTKSHFIFQNSKKTKFDWGYDINSKFIQDTFQKIKSRGHFIGYHPGFYTLDNPELWKKEYEELCNSTAIKIEQGRQHYLRFKAPFTWQIWEDNGLETDSTLGYSEREGFRCGTCYEYSVYNFLTRKKLKLKEVPLILMEVSLMGYQNIIEPKIFFERFDTLVKKVRKYAGNFVFLWHNSAFDRSVFTKNFYKELITHLNN